MGEVDVCESCAGEVEEDDLEPVWPATGPGDGPELWCSSCRDLHPHDPAGDDIS